MALSNKFSIICVVTSSIATLFSAVTLMSANYSRGVVSDLAWSSGSLSEDDVSFDFYVGMYELLQSYNADDDGWYTYKYADENCSFSFCDECESGNQALLAFLAIFFLASLPNCLTHCMRFKDDYNTAMIRNISVIFSVICFLAGGSGLISFAVGCQNSINNDITEVDFNYGPAFGLLITATLFKLIEIVFTLLISVSDGQALANQTAGSPTAPSNASNPVAAKPAEPSSPAAPKI